MVSSSRAEELISKVRNDDTTIKPLGYKCPIRGWALKNVSIRGIMPWLTIRPHMPNSVSHKLYSIIIIMAIKWGEKNTMQCARPTLFACHHHDSEMIDWLVINPQIHPFTLTTKLMKIKCEEIGSVTTRLCHSLWGVCAWSPLLSPRHLSIFKLIAK